LAGEHTRGGGCGLSEQYKNRESYFCFEPIIGFNARNVEPITPQCWIPYPRREQDDGQPEGLT